MLLKETKVKVIKLTTEEMKVIELATDILEKLKFNLEEEDDFIITQGDNGVIAEDELISVTDVLNEIYESDDLRIEKKEEHTSDIRTLY